MRFNAVGLWFIEYRERSVFSGQSTKDWVPNVTLWLHSNDSCNPHLPMRFSIKMTNVLISISGYGTTIVSQINIKKALTRYSSRPCQILPISIKLHVCYRCIPISMVMPNANANLITICARKQRDQLDIEFRHKRERPSDHRFRVARIPHTTIEIHRGMGRIDC